MSVLAYNSDIGKVEKPRPWMMYSPYYLFIVNCVPGKPTEDHWEAILKDSVSSSEYEAILEARARASKTRKNI